jgi:hypothetical protein
VKKLLLMFVVSALALSVNGQALASNTGTTDTSVPAIYDLENEPSQCIGLLPRPGCGKKPEDAGERGGALQYSVFGLMITGLGVIGLGMVRGIRKQKPQS